MKNFYKTIRRRLIGGDPQKLDIKSNDWGSVQFETSFWFIQGCHSRHRAAEKPIWSLR